MAKDINVLENLFSIRRITSSNDEDLISALCLYSKVTSTTTKTGTNEITFFIDQPANILREMYFFCLYYNKKVIGYIQCGILSKTKTLILDYVLIEETYNGIYYPLFSLFQQFISTIKTDINQILMEVNLSNCDNCDDLEIFSTRKFLFYEDFKIIDAPYIQPSLGVENHESITELNLIIKMVNNPNSIKSVTYLSILEDLYENHYIEWYSHFMDNNELESYKKTIQNLKNESIEKLSKKDSLDLLDGHIQECEHYNSHDCKYYNKTSTAGFVEGYNNKKQLSVLPYCLAVFTISLVVSLIFYNIMSYFDIPISEVSTIFNAAMLFLGSLCINYFLNRKT